MVIGTAITTIITELLTGRDWAIVQEKYLLPVKIGVIATGTLILTITTIHIVLLKELTRPHLPVHLPVVFLREAQVAGQFHVRHVINSPDFYK